VLGRRGELLDAMIDGRANALHEFDARIREMLVHSGETSKQLAMRSMNS